MSRQRRLGRGIDALLQGRDLESLDTGDINSIVTVPIDQIRPNPEQPRTTFAPEALEELARSIEERGIIQPLLAEQRSDGTYVIIAGERRYRAAEMAGLTVVPILPGVFSEDEKLEIALIENIQREDLTPIEEARAYRELMERSGSNQEEFAHRIGKSRSAIANSLRLLRLPEETQELANRGVLSAGHARTLLGLKDQTLIPDVTRILTDETLSVRALERLVNLVNEGRTPDEALPFLYGARAPMPASETATSDTRSRGRPERNQPPGERRGRRSKWRRSNKGSSSASAHG